MVVVGLKVFSIVVSLVSVIGRMKTASVLDQLGLGIRGALVKLAVGLPAVLALYGLGILV